MAGQGQDMKQGVYKTPPDFMAAVRYEFPIVFDLAASAENAQAENYFTEAEDALNQSWHQLNAQGGWLWLNPPYSNIEPWARKCAREMEYGAKILFLVPAAVGSNWFADSVHGIAEVRFPRPRLIFEFRYPDDYRDKKGNLSPKAGKMNTDPYPKDLLLAAFFAGTPRPRICYPWRWK